MDRKLTDEEIQSLPRPQYREYIHAMTDQEHEQYTNRCQAADHLERGITPEIRAQWAQEDLEDSEPDSEEEEYQQIVAALEGAQIPHEALLAALQAHHQQAASSPSEPF